MHSENLKYLLISLFFLLPVLVGNTARAEGEYKLGPRDKVLINVVEWRATLDKIHSWDAVNRQYTISANGSITIPLVGRLKADGLSVDQLADRISSSLQAKMNLVSAPHTTVEVMQYRPFYVLGLVDKPGEYAFRPGLTALQALSISGGQRRVQNTGFHKLERERVTIEGTIRRLVRELSLLEIEKLGLASELERKDILEIPELLERDLKRSGYGELIKRAKMSYAVKKESRIVKLKGLNEKQALVRKQITTLNDQVKVKRNELKVISVQEKKANYLSKRKLINLNEIFKIKRLKSAALGQMSDIRVKQIEARNSFQDITQRIKEADHTLDEVISKRLQTVESGIRDKAGELRTSRILQKNILSNPEYIGREKDTSKGKSHLLFKILRTKNGIQREFVVTGGYPVKPGDVVRVEQGFEVEAPKLAPASTKTQ